MNTGRGGIVDTRSKRRNEHVNENEGAENKKDRSENERKEKDEDATRS